MSLDPDRFDDAVIRAGAQVWEKTHVPFENVEVLKLIVREATSGLTPEAPIVGRHAKELESLEKQHKAELTERYEAGKRRMRRKHADLQDAVKALELARAMIVDTVSWQGSETRRDEVIAELDKAISYFTP